MILTPKRVVPVGPADVVCSANLTDTMKHNRSCRHLLCSRLCYNILFNLNLKSKAVKIADYPVCLIMYCANYDFVAMATHNKHNLTFIFLHLPLLYILI